MAVNHREEHTPAKYYWWSSLRLDSDPLNKNPALARPCANEKPNCENEAPLSRNVSPTGLDKLLVISGIPAFLVGAAVVISLSRLGIDEVLTFMVSMPILLFAWYYFLGWLIERWSYRRTQTKSVPLKIG